MRNRKQLLCIALTTLALIVGAWISPSAEAAPGDTCFDCATVEVPDPYGGPPTTYTICIDFDRYIGWVECWAYPSNCALWVNCDPWPC